MTSPDVPARIPSTGSFRELGPFGWVFCKLAARRQHLDQVNLFTTLGIHRPLLMAWLPYSAYLLFAGKLSRRDAELVILRVGHLRNCEYELQQHRRLARTRGVDAQLQARIFEGPDAEGLTERQRALITATDEFVVTRGVSAQTWSTLAQQLTKPQLIEFCMLAAQYDGLAAMMSALHIPLDYPD
jgi:AhpD family alkylhydroperoxidase